MLAVLVPPDEVTDILAGGSIAAMPWGQPITELGSADSGRRRSRPPPSGNAINFARGADLVS